MILRPYEKYNRPKDIMMDNLKYISFLETNYLKNEFYFGYLSLYTYNEIKISKFKWKI